MRARRTLLEDAVIRVGDGGPTLLITPAGFLGFCAGGDGALSWTGVADVASLEKDIAGLASSWPTSLMGAVGVECDDSDQRQW